MMAVLFADVVEANHDAGLPLPCATHLRAKLRRIREIPIIQLELTLGDLAMLDRALQELEVGCDRCSVHGEEQAEGRMTPARRHVYFTGDFGAFILCRKPQRPDRRLEDP